MDPSESDSTVVSDSIKEPELGFQSSPPSFPNPHNNHESSDLNHSSEVDSLHEELQEKLDLKDEEEEKEEEEEAGETEKKDSEVDDGKDGDDAGESEKEQVCYDDNWNWDEDENVNDNENNKFGIDDAIVGDDVEKKDEEISGRFHQYPVRPDAEDCAFYLKTGTCKFGFNCKFNHPLRRKNQVSLFLENI